jgi:hypothetical protein
MMDAIAFQIQLQVRLQLPVHGNVSDF